MTQTANYIRFTNMPSLDNTLFFDRNDSYVTIYLWTTLPNLEPISSDDSWCTLSLNGKELTIRVNSTNKNRMTTINFKGYKESLIVGQCKYALGDDYNEDGISGIVCSLDINSGKVGRIIDGTYQWSTENVQIGATEENDGEINFNLIKSIPNWTSLYPAFAKCDELNTNGIQGWYIPAKEELRLTSRYFIRTNISNFYVWSSTEKDYQSSYTSSGHLEYYGWYYGFSNKASYVRLGVLHKFSILY